jgi:CheY-like chemotaxis protein
MPEDTIKLLIVDDEPSTRTALAQIFARMGHSVRSAEDGFSALEQIREAVPDVLVSDLNMPGMSGFELLSVVRRRLPAIYVIATSGAYTGKEVPHGIAADAFYEKASNLRSLLSLIETASQLRETPMRGLSEPAPIWISRTDDEPPGEKYVMISCPDCLRAFPQGFSDSKMIIHEAGCIYCRTTIRFAVVQPLDPLTSQPYVAWHAPSRVAATSIDVLRKNNGPVELVKRTCA